MIGTPTYDGKLDTWYVNSLIRTIKESAERGVEITPIWVGYDALIQRARNDIIHLAIQDKFDDMIFIDSDIEWDPLDFYKLLEYSTDVIGGTYPKKNDNEEYVVRQDTTQKVDNKTGLLRVAGLGTGFVKLSRKAMLYLWDISEMYIDPKDNVERRMIFDVAIKNSKLYSEDINMFEKLSDGGFEIWLDSLITCNHIGMKKYTGNFSDWVVKNNIPNDAPSNIAPIINTQVIKKKL